MQVAVAGDEGRHQPAEQVHARGFGIAHEWQFRNAECLCQAVVGEIVMMAQVRIARGDDGEQALDETRPMMRIPVEAFHRQGRDAVEVDLPVARNVEPQPGMHVEGQGLQFHDAGIGGGLFELEHHVERAGHRLAGGWPDAPVPPCLGNRNQQLGDGATDAGRGADELQEQIRLFVEPGEELPEGEGTRPVEADEAVRPGPLVPGVRGLVVLEHVQMPDATVSGHHQDRPVGIEAFELPMATGLQVAQREIALEVAAVTGRHQRLQRRQQIEALRAPPHDGALAIHRRREHQTQTGQAALDELPGIGEAALSLGDQQPAHLHRHPAQPGPDHGLPIRAHRSNSPPRSIFSTSGSSGTSTGFRPTTRAIRSRLTSPMFGLRLARESVSAARPAARAISAWVMPRARPASAI